MNRALVLATLGILLSACGQKGPLYLPDTEPSNLVGASVQESSAQEQELSQKSAVQTAELSVSSQRGISG